jgi:hypothetical protein
MTEQPKLSLAIVKQTNCLDKIDCYEPVPVATLKAYMKTDLLKHNFKNPITRDMVGSEKKQLTRYKSLINEETSLAKVSYKRTTGMSFGRSNPNGAVGMFSMRKQTRHTLAKRTGMVDYDIVNCHPELLLQLCKANGLSCKELEYYVANRNPVLERLMRITGCDRDRAKELFIRLLYFGSFKNWLKEKRDPETKEIIQPEICIYAFQNDMDFVNWIDALVAELAIIGEHIVKANPKLTKEIEKNKELKKKTNYNKTGSVVSFFLQEYEIRVLETLYKYCCEKGYIVNNVCVLCADGIMLEEARVQGADLLTEFNQVVKEKTGFNLRFDKKEMNECLTDEFIQEHIISEKDLDRAKFERFDNDYFNSLAGYRRKQIYFEMFVCKILRPDPVYAYIETDCGFDEMSFYTQSKITEAFNHLKTGEFYDNGEPEKFMTKWLGDESIRCYNKMDFLPFNEKEPIPPHIFNLFRGFNPKCGDEFSVSIKDKLLKPFFDLGKELCGGDEKCFAYLLKYIADIFQNPRRKNPIAFIIKGKQGTGKNVFLNAVGTCLGKSHYITSSNPKDFFGDYAEGFYHKLLVNMNECEGRDTFDFEGRIKSFITEDSITLNRKFVQPITISNLARLIIFTNKATPIPIDIRSKDRRYVVYETTDHYLNPKYGTEFWKKLVAHFNRPDFIACLYDYFNTMEIDDFDWRTERPITPAYLQMCKVFVPAEVLWLEYKISNAKKIDNQPNQEFKYFVDWKHEGVSGLELYNQYKDFCKQYGFHKDASYEKSTKTFYAKLRELELPLIQTNPQGSTHFKFDYEEVLLFMKQRKWIDYEDNEKVETKQEIKGEDFSELFEGF